MRIFHPYIEQRPQFSPAVLEEIKQALRNNVGSLSEDLLGPRNTAKSTRSEWRWNSSGSFSVKVSGPKRGACVDFASDWKGDPLALIMRERNCGFAEATVWAAAWAGITDGPRPHHEPRRTEAQQRAEDAEHAAEVAKRAADARAIWDRAAPLAGTLAERYLIEARGIPAPDNGWPECLRATNNALIVAATDNAGTVQGIQRVFLTVEARNAKDDQGKSVKRSVGPFSDTEAVVRLPGAADGPLLLAEGPETGLSVWRATGHETWVAVGSLSNFRPPQGRRVVVCRDDDATHSPADKTLRRYLDEWRKAGVNIVVATPWPKRREDKSDFNDTIREGGIDAVRARIEQALAAGAGPEPCDPPFTAPTLTADEAAASLVEPIEAFFAKAEETAIARMNAQLRQYDNGGLGLGIKLPLPQGEQAMVLTGLGIGKSRQALGRAGMYLSASNDAVARTKKMQRRIIYHVPDHNLAADIAARMKDMHPNVGVHVHLGLERPDPNHPDYSNPDVPEEAKTKMCRRVADVNAVIEAGGEMGVLCGNKERGFCPFHPKVAGEGSACGYKSAGTLDGGMVILAGPQVLKESPPAKFARFKTIKGEFKRVSPPKHGQSDTVKQRNITFDPCDILISDEPRMMELLGGMGQSPYELDPDKLTSPLTPFGRDFRGTETEDSGEVADAFMWLHRHVEGVEQGPLTHAALKEITGTWDWSAIKKAAWRFKESPANHITPDMRGQELRDIAKKLKTHNDRVWRRTRVAEVILDAMTAMKGKPDDARSGLIALVVDGDNRLIRLHWRNPIGEVWRDISTLLLDGTADPEINLEWLSELEVIADAQAATPAYVTRRQVWDNAFAYTSWVPEDPRARSEEKNEKTRWNNVERILRFLTVLGARYRGQGQDGIDVLAIVPERMQIALETLWASLGGIPAGVAVEHLNNIRGVDRYKGVRAIVVVSRTQPSAQTLETTTWALTGVVGTELPSEAKGLLPEAEAAYLMRDGSGRRAKVRQHPDPMVRKVNWQITNAEVVQSEARARAVRRTSDSPLDVFILTNAVLPLEIDELLTAEQMLAEATVPHWLVASGVVPDLNGRGHREFLATVLGIDDEAVKKRLQRESKWKEVLGRFQPGSPGTNAIGYTPMENVPSESWNLFGVKTGKETRYSLPVWITANDEPAARTRLRAVGVDPAEVRLMPKAEPKVAQPDTNLPPISAAVNTTLATPALNASVDVLAIPEPANEPVEVLPWNGLAPAQQAAVAELVEQWRGDDLVMIFEKALPPLPRKQRIAVQPVRADATLPSFAAPANADPVAPCIEGVCGEGLDPSAVFGRDRDMAIATGVWRLGGNGIRTAEEWRRAPILLPPEVQAAL